MLPVVADRASGSAGGAEEIVLAICRRI